MNFPSFDQWAPARFPFRELEDAWNSILLGFRESSLALLEKIRKDFRLYRCFCSITPMPFITGLSWKYSGNKQVRITWTTILTRPFTHLIEKETGAIRVPARRSSG
ncbi:MAG: hypothetical protein U0T56_12450 [Ferruginibacter sp.]